VCIYIYICDTCYCKNIRNFCETYDQYMGGNSHALSPGPVSELLFCLLFVKAAWRSKGRAVCRHGTFFNVAHAGGAALHVPSHIPYIFSINGI